MRKIPSPFFPIFLLYHRLWMIVYFYMKSVELVLLFSTLLEKLPFIAKYRHFKNCQLKNMLTWSHKCHITKCSEYFKFLPLTFWGLGAKHRTEPEFWLDWKELHNFWSLQSDIEWSAEATKIPFPSAVQQMSKIAVRWAC